LFTSLAVGSGEAEWTVALVVVGTQQAARSSVLTRVVRADRRPLILALGDVLARDRFRRQVDRKAAHAQLQTTKQKRVFFSAHGLLSTCILAASFLLFYAFCVLVHLYCII